VSTAPAAPVSMNETGGKKRSPAAHIFDDMRQKIAEVFPNEDEEAWSWTSEDYSENSIGRTEPTYEQWYSEKFVGSDEFSQLFTKRMYMVWDELQKDSFKANDKELWDHQKALFAWTALNICTGNREEMAKLLIRSPYGSGKSLVTGLITRAFRDAQLELLHLDNVSPQELPTGAQIFVKKEHMAQNANGDQFSILQPPYNVERTDINQYWRDMNARYGEAFSSVFPQPKKAADPFYAIFREGEDEASATVDQRIATYLSTSERTVEDTKTQKMLKEFKDLAEGKIVFLPDVENNIVPQPAQEREEANGNVRFKGDSAHALQHLDDYYIATSHKSLALDQSAYRTVPDEDEPAQFALVYGAALTRQYDRIRKDLQALAKRCKALFIDEAGRLNPYTIGDSVAQHSGALPIEIGVTGYDKGVEGWTRSPTISEEKMIELGLMKPIAYIGIGDAENPPSPGTEEAWKSYEEAHFEDYDTAKKLGIPQPHQKDTVICAKGDNVHEYAKRIQLAHAERNIPVEVFVYHADAKDRKSSVLNAFKAPKTDASSKRILVATNTLIAEAHTIPNAEVYDVVDPITQYMMDQLRGRLGHVRNLKGTDEEKENARTVIRELFLHKGKDPYVRVIAKKFGFSEDLPDENASWPPLKNMIGLATYIADGAKSVFGDVRAIMDAPRVWRRKKKIQGGVAEKVGTPLTHTNPHALSIANKRAEQQIRRLQKRAENEEKEAKKVEKMLLSPEKKTGESSQEITQKIRIEEAAANNNTAGFKPTNAIPGSEEKLIVIAYRERMRLPLYHPDDRKDYELLSEDSSLHDENIDDYLDEEDFPEIDL